MYTNMNKVTALLNSDRFQLYHQGNASDITNSDVVNRDSVSETLLNSDGFNCIIREMPVTLLIATLLIGIVFQINNVFFFAFIRNIFAFKRNNFCVYSQ